MNVCMMFVVLSRRKDIVDFVNRTVTPSKEERVVEYKNLTYREYERTGRMNVHVWNMNISNFNL